MTTINKRLERLEQSTRPTERGQALNDATYNRALDTLGEALAGILELPEVPSREAINKAIREVTA